MVDFRSICTGGRNSRGKCEATVMTLYINLAELLGTRIEQGLYRPGDRLPSVRALSLEHGVSLGPGQQAHPPLEKQGLATPKPQARFFGPQGPQPAGPPMVSRMA